MAATTLNIGLTLPAFGEFTDSWNTPINNNFTIIDAQIGTLIGLTGSAAGTQADLNTRLSVSLNPDGSLKPIPEVEAARNSSVYGAANGTTDFVLDDRLEAGDREVFNARSGALSLSAALAANADDFVSNSVISSATNFLTFTGANVKADGSVTPIVANINGFRQVVRTQKSVAISGPAATYYVTLNLNAGGDVLVAQLNTGSQNTGSISADVNSNLTLFMDSTQNFVASGVQPGDLLTITTVGSPNYYTYTIAAVNGANSLSIVGWFELAQTGLNYQINNPLAPALNFTATPNPARYARSSGLIYIGSCVFDGTNVTSLIQYQAKGRFEQWFSVSLTSGNFLITALHSIGFVPTKLWLYASQANDYSQPIEPLGVVSISGSGVSDDRAVMCNVSQSAINVRNVTNGVFYMDFSGTAQASGFLLVIAER